MTLNNKKVLSFFFTIETEKMSVKFVSSIDILIYKVVILKSGSLALTLVMNILKLSFSSLSLNCVVT